MTFERVDGQLSLWSDTDSAEQDWTVRISRRARRLSVRVHLTGRVEVVVPPRTSARTVARFVGQHRDWIVWRRAEARRNAPPVEPFPPRVIDLAACSERWRLHLAGGSGLPRMTEAAAGLLTVSGDVTNAAPVRRELQEWLITRARAVLEARLSELARSLGFEYRRVTVRRQRSRWGSCSVRGTISLNCCLLFQRPEVVRYLLIHELAHTVHMNHSARFWRTVVAHAPDCRQLDRELLGGWRRVPSWVFDDRASP
jgi:predicted metal-dependent hydrolase